MAFASCDVTLTASAVVRVTVNRNLFSPVFGSGSITTSPVLETVAPGTVVATVNATDADQVGTSDD